MRERDAPGIPGLGLFPRKKTCEISGTETLPKRKWELTFSIGKSDMLVCLFRYVWKKQERFLSWSVNYYVLILIGKLDNLIYLIFFQLVEMLQQAETLDGISWSIVWGKITRNAFVNKRGVEWSHTATENAQVSCEYFSSQGPVKIYWVPKPGFQKVFSKKSFRPSIIFFEKKSPPPFLSRKKFSPHVNGSGLGTPLILTCPSWLIWFSYFQ